MVSGGVQCPCRTDDRDRSNHHRCTLIRIPSASAKGGRGGAPDAAGGHGGASDATGGHGGAPEATGGRGEIPKAPFGQDTKPKKRGARSQRIDGELRSPEDIRAWKKRILKAMGE
jgi:hypothetical protein